MPGYKRKGRLVPGKTFPAGQGPEQLAHLVSCERGLSVPQPEARAGSPEGKGGAGAGSGCTCLTGVTYKRISCTLNAFLSGWSDLPFFPFLGCLATRWRLNRLHLIRNNQTAGHMAGPGVFQLHSHDISNGKVYRMLHSTHDVLVSENRPEQGTPGVWTGGC